MKTIAALTIAAAISLYGCAAVESSRLGDNPTPQQLSNVEEAKRYDSQVTVPAVVMGIVDAIFHAAF